MDGLQSIIEMLRVLLTTLLVAFASSQSLINRVRVDGAQPSGGCWLRIVNTEEVLDFRTDCLLGNQTDAPGYQALIQFIKPKAAYLINETTRSIWGYRYFKDPLNYWFAFYNFTTYHETLQILANQLGLASIPMPFDERYTFNLEYSTATDSWKLLTLEVSYLTPKALSIEQKEYSVRTWLDQSQATEKSIASRRIRGEGDNQPVNVTLELSRLDEEIIQSSHKCTVIIEEILPEWFFISYDDLHTIDKFEVFDIELPAHFAKQYFFRYSIPITKFQKVGPQKYTYVYPMRVRYPPPGDSYIVTVGLHPNDKISVQCGERSFVIEEDLLNDRGHRDMYAGKQSDAQFVTITTYAISLITAVWILRKHKKCSGL